MLARSLVATVVLTTTLVVAASSPAGPAPPKLAGVLAHRSGDDGPGDGGDEGPIDCSIPDNQDDSGCDKGDVEDGAGAVGDSGDVAAPKSRGPDHVVPRGAVQTGAGGTAVGWKTSADRRTRSAGRHGARWLASRAAILR
jgi:hypothetical protein